MTKKYRMILTSNPGAVDSNTVVDIVTHSESIASVWCKKVCHIWENEDGNGCFPDEDGNTIFTNASGNDECYSLEFIVLDIDEDTEDAEVIDTEEDMPQFAYTYMSLVILTMDMNEYSDVGVTTVK